MRRAILLLLTALAAGGPAAAAVRQSRPQVENGAGAFDADYRRGLEALRGGRLDEAQTTALSILNAQPRLAPGRQLLGLVKLKRGDLAGALLEFDRALASDPQFIPAREERAVALARMGHSGRARGDLEALKAREAACAKACPPELRPAVSRVEAALAAARPPAVIKDAASAPSLSIGGARGL